MSEFTLQSRVTNGQIVILAEVNPIARLPAGSFEADAVSQPEGSIWFWVARVYVHPRFRSKGLASKLLAHACEIADERQIVMYLCPNPYDSTIDLGRLVALYERFGFVAQEDEDGVIYVRRPTPGI